MDDSRCYKIANKLQELVAYLFHMQLKISTLYSTRNTKRVYYKRLTHRTNEFIKSNPSLRIVHSHNIARGNGTLVRIAVSDLCMKLTYGDKPPFIDLAGPWEGWQVILSVMTGSVIDLWSWYIFWELNF